MAISTSFSFTKITRGPFCPRNDLRIIHPRNHGVTIWFISGGLDFSSFWDHEIDGVFLPKKSGRGLGDDFFHLSQGYHQDEIIHIAVAITAKNYQPRQLPYDFS